MGACSSSANRHSDEGYIDIHNEDILNNESRDELESKISDIINIDIQDWKQYIEQFNEPISADQLQIWSRQLELISTPSELSNIDNLLRIKQNIYSIDARKYKNYLINFIRALLKKPNQNRVILVDLIYLLKICQDDLLSLYATLQIFYDIGFRTTFDYQQPCLIFNYKDVTHCKSILFWLQLHCKINNHHNRKYSKNIKKKNKKNCHIQYDHHQSQLCMTTNNESILQSYKKYEAKLILFITHYTMKYYTHNSHEFISTDIIRLISHFVVIDFEMTDSWGNYIKSIFSFNNNQLTHNINLNIFDMQRNDSYDIKIKDMVSNTAISNIHEMIVLKDQSIPNWVHWHYDKIRKHKIKDLGTFFIYIFFQFYLILI